MAVSGQPIKEITWKSVNVHCHAGIKGSSGENCAIQFLFDTILKRKVFCFFKEHKN